jgi:WD40 repeat protein
VVSTVRFSEDGKRLFVSGYPSGIVQVWDWAAKKELRRIDTPSGLRGSASYAIITPDWKTLYVPIESKKVISSEKDGRVVQRLEYSGRIGVWDVATGAERTPLRPPEGSAPYYAVLSPDGRHLVSCERLSFSAGEPRRGGVWDWDLQTGARRKIWDGTNYPRFSPDGRTIAFTAYEREANGYILKLIDLATGKERASFRCQEKDSIMLGGDFSPDGSIITTDIRGPKGSKPMIHFLDAKTLAERGRFVGVSEPDGIGWISTVFTPDGRSCVLLDMAGKAHIWNLSTQKEVRSFAVGAHSFTMTFSPVGRTLAVAWSPKPPAELENAHNTDPRDLPQPRVTLFDLAGNKPPRPQIAPHGFIGGLAFSPDGQTLAFGTSGGVRLFDLSR